MTRKVTYYAGKPIEELTREELIDALNDCAAELDRYRSPEACRANALGRVEMLKRGETFSQGSRL